MDAVQIVVLFTLAPLVVSHQFWHRRLPLLDTAGCAQELECYSTAKYRTVDGSCNNLRHPAWGQAGRPFARVVEANYHDRKWKPRRSVTGGPLPHVRGLSNAIFHNKFESDQYNTYNLMQWGQVIAHDVTHNVPNTTTESGKTCCTADNRVPERHKVSANCLPMKVPSDDPFYSDHNIRCLNFSRASPTNSGTCSKYPLEQLNNITSFIDASFVYGSYQYTADGLRTFSNGRLKYQLSKDGRHFLPNADDPLIPCINSSVCYDAGDDRVNQNTDITVYQIMFMRLHNYLCKKLAKMNPSWDDERLYQEARRIVWAFIQHVTYNHFLPIILGINYTKSRALSLDFDPDKCEIYYNPDVNPSTLTEFASAAYRSFHSMVPDKVMFVDKGYESDSYIYLDNYYFSPHYLQDPKVLDMCLRGLVTQPSQVMDVHVVDAVRNKLFKFGNKWGNDLESIDMMRGRDMGLPTYNKMRHLCGLKLAEKFEDFRDVMSEELIGKLKTFYHSVDDVDLFVGAMCETKLPGTLVGPVNQCIMGEQFHNYLRGDRFFYRNCGFPWSLTKEQRAAIYETSLAWLFCTVGDNISAMSQNTFRKPSKSNPIVPCKMISKLDLTPWLEF